MLCLLINMVESFEEKRKKLVELLKRRGDIKSKKVEKAFLNVKRELFVPEEYEKYAYEDEPLPLKYGQTISAPHIVAIMTELLDVKRNHKVLEIGTGSGYQSAILSYMAKKVISIERIEDLVKFAKGNLKKAGIKNVDVIHGNGFDGYEKEMPYDRIIVTACPEKIPEKLIKQLKMNGKMVIPLKEDYEQYLYVIEKRNGLKMKRIIPVIFVPMIDEI